MLRQATTNRNIEVDEAKAAKEAEERALIVFLETLRDLPDDAKLAYIAADTAGMSIKKLRLTMNHLSVNLRHELSERHVKADNFAFLLQFFEDMAVRVAFVAAHRDSISKDNLGAIVAALPRENQIEFVRENKDKVNSENIFIIASALVPADFGVVIVEHTDKLTPKNFAALLDKFTLEEVSLADHIKLYDALMPLLQQKTIIGAKVLALHGSLIAKIKKCQKGIMFLKPDSRRTALEILKDVLEIAKGVLAKILHSDSEKVKVTELSAITATPAAPVAQSKEAVADSKRFPNVLNPFKAISAPAIAVGSASRPGMGLSNEQRVWQRVAPTRSRLATTSDETKEQSGSRFFTAPKPPLHSNSKSAGLQKPNQTGIRIRRGSAAE
jgi:hypothetical protein